LNLTERFGMLSLEMRSSPWRTNTLWNLWTLHR